MPVDEQESAEGGASHFQNSSTAIDLGQEVWHQPISSGTLPQFTVPTDDIKALFADALASRKQEKTFENSVQKDMIRQPSTRELTSASAQDVQAWLSNVRQRRDSDGRPYLNTNHFEAVQKVAQRVMQELNPAANETVDFGEPLRWLIHGGPGTGKSHVIKEVKELFTTVLGWNIGVDFHLVALQAVMAALIGGDTIHHACGLVPAQFRRTQTVDEAIQNQTEISKHMLQ